MTNQFESALFYRNQYFERFMTLEMQAIDTKRIKLLEYIRDLQKQMDDLIFKISGQNFWDTLPMVLGIDARVSLLEQFEDGQLSEEELINLVETEFHKINQGNFGYRLNEGLSKSMTFFIE